MCVVPKRHQILDRILATAAAAPGQQPRPETGKTGTHNDREPHRRPDRRGRLR